MARPQYPPYRVPEPCSCGVIVDRTPIDISIKAAALKASPSIVSVITHNIPDDMIRYRGIPIDVGGEGKYACPGSGVIIQSHDAEDGSYFGTILAPADLFKRTNDLPPQQIPVDVRVFGSEICKGELLACDFHYNLAAIRIRSDSPLKPATIRHLRDATFTDDDVSNQHIQSSGKKRQRLSNSFNVEEGTRILTASRYGVGNYGIKISTGVLSARDMSQMPRKEFFSMKGSKLKCGRGGAVLNYKGEVIGIFFSNASFLPFNLVSRWWDHFESCRKYRRPYIGVEVAPNTMTGVGVAVTKVEKNSPAHRSGIKRNDVIIECDAVSIRSKLEFLESVWDNAGKAVKLKVVKASNGVTSDVKSLIEETPGDKLYEWKLPGWWKYADGTAPESTFRALRECTTRAHHTTLEEMS